MGICLGLNPEIQNKPADPYDNRKCSGMRIFQDFKLFFFCFIRTECICCIQKTIQMDPSGDQNRDQDQNCFQRASLRQAYSTEALPLRSQPRLPEKSRYSTAYFLLSIPPAALGSSNTSKKQRTNFFLYFSCHSLLSCCQKQQL